jgi:predicted type IV restriction endonuclease
MITKSVIISNSKHKKENAMSFEEKIKMLSEKIPTVVNQLQTEEATKTALVMPFISALGYDVFNPCEVIPEYTADIGKKKGEKVDYALVRDDEIVILIECKSVQTDLSEAEFSQLFRYFHTTKARIAILTNGINYWFFTDLEDANKMDEKPFLKLNLLSPRTFALAEVRKLVKSEFELQKMLCAANDLKYTSEFKSILLKQIEQPDEDFVRLFFSKSSATGRFNATAKELYTPLVAKAFSQIINDKVSDRLSRALQTEKQKIEAESVQNDKSDDSEELNEGVITTEEELEGYRIVRSIASEIIPAERVFFRDHKEYFNVLLDNNRLKPICRFRFNTKQKYVGTFNSEKNETRIPIENLAEIYKQKSAIFQTIQNYDESDQG